VKQPRMSAFAEAASRRSAADVECLAILRRIIDENRTMVAQSRAVIEWSDAAMALLDRLQGPNALRESSPRSPAVALAAFVRKPQRVVLRLAASSAAKEFTA